MRAIGLNDVIDALDEAIPGKVCVEAWLGAGHVLFLGFDDAMPAVPTESDALPPYQLQMDFADWWIEDSERVIGASTEERPLAEAVAHQLVGRKAVGWCFIQSSLAIQVDFEGGFRVRTAPMAGDDILREGAWILKMPDRYYRHAKWDGTLYMVHAEEPGSPEPLDYL